MTPLCDRCLPHQLGSPAQWNTAAYTTRDGRKLTWYVPFAEVIIRLRAAEGQPIVPLELRADEIDAGWSSDWGTSQRRCHTSATGKGSVSVASPALPVVAYRS